MKIKLSHATYNNCSLEFHEYPNRSPALVIYQDGEVLLKASVALPHYLPPEGYICIKDWSENEGILESLIKNEVIELPMMFIPTGFVQVAVCKLIGDYHVK